MSRKRFSKERWRPGIPRGYRSKEQEVQAEAEANIPPIDWDAMNEAFREANVRYTFHMIFGQPTSLHDFLFGHRVTVNVGPEWRAYRGAQGRSARPTIVDLDPDQWSEVHQPKPMLALPSGERSDSD